MLDFIAQARQLVQNLDGHLSTSAYDVAWLAQLPGDEGNGLRWPELIDWLLRHQWPDGSWGGTIPYYHDRILSTLAAIIALKECGASLKAERAIRQGIQYLWHHFHFLPYDPIELVGFELILPTLLSQARALDLDVPTHYYGYEHIRAQKLSLLPEGLFYSPSTSVAFSAEFLGAAGDPTRLRQLQGDHGAIANSPATTAYLVRQGGCNQVALDYLEKLRIQPPAFYPWRTFEIVWTLEHLTFGGLSLRGLVKPSIWAELQAALEFGEIGVGIDPSFGINDGDTTSVTLHVLARGGQPVNHMILRHFESPRTGLFHTFPFERNPSVVTNVHALEAMSFLPDYPNFELMRGRIVAMVLRTQQQSSYWVDKWHASPYYATAHVLIAFIRTQESLLNECHNAIEWLIHTQRPEGSWGFFDWGTLEETAYALLTLLHYHRQFKKLNTEVLRLGATYLFHWMEREDWADPEMWIAKSLYAPRSIIKAAVLAAAHLYQDTFGRPPD
jgi:halimadienyl-diphosphate synthase